MDINTLKSIAEFGSVGIAIFLAYVLWRLSESVIKLMTNHVNHNTAALTKLECMIAKLCKIIDKKK